MIFLSNLTLAGEDTAFLPLTSLSVRVTANVLISYGLKLVISLPFSTTALHLNSSLANISLAEAIPAPSSISTFSVLSLAPSLSRIIISSLSSAFFIARTIILPAESLPKL